ncbi:IucA/IucC family C-terminal-domain containing protein [Oceanospirillum sediminis]|uniref:(2Fe-2S)-binding protein n=1 Tax=Oceanospirillum sediminis TaxID=2760088 RepID=A0A839IYH7_9GAMM|nr:IucA/IucC family C-terminal-domain containing protein [Oceanospirillum sediminis]MBB1489146.1 (2Fe-2S)-binding protein [Oceanospirillum sediminis]
MSLLPYSRESVSHQPGFCEQEWAVLSGNFRLKVFEDRDRRAIRAVDLLDENNCRQLLDQLTPVLCSPNRAVTASLLAKRIAFLTTGACLYSMSVYNKGLLMSPDNSWIEYGHDDGLWTSCMPLRSIEPLIYAPGQRNDWRETLIKTLFADLLAPLWTVLHQVSGISLRILWENTAVRVYSLYERKMDNVTDEETCQQAQADFDWLLNKASPELFTASYNPLQRFRQPICQTDKGAVRFRRTCCLYYKTTEPKEYCSACSLLKPRPGKIL